MIAQEQPTVTVVSVCSRAAIEGHESLVHHQHRGYEGGMGPREAHPDRLGLDRVAAAGGQQRAGDQSLPFWSAAISPALGVDARATHEPWVFLGTV